MSLATDRAAKALETANEVLRENAQGRDEAMVRNTNAQAIAEQGIGWALLAIAEQLEGGTPIRAQ